MMDTELVDDLDAAGHDEHDETTAASGSTVLSDEHRQVFSLSRTAVVAVVVMGLAQAAVLLCLVLLLHQVVAMAPTSVQAASVGPGRALVLTGLIAGAGLVLGGLRAMEFSVAEVAGYQVVRRAR
ncbi:MAG: hypothetical protein FWF02_14855, partial [Micrococcales bacterium]|nr:hypothetical protein [Micrococcales bacterium]